MCPIFCCSTKCFTVADIGLTCFYPLNFFLDKSVICRRNALSLLWWANYGDSRRFMMTRLERCKLAAFRRRWSTFLGTTFEARVLFLRLLMILKGKCLKQSSNINRQQIRTVPTSHRYKCRDSATWNTYREHGVAEVAVDVTNTFWGRDVDWHIFIAEREREREIRRRTKKGSSFNDRDQQLFLEIQQRPVTETKYY